MRGTRAVVLSCAMMMLAATALLGGCFFIFPIPGSSSTTRDAFPREYELLRVAYPAEWKLDGPFASRVETRPDRRVGGAQALLDDVRRELRQTGERSLALACGADRVSRFVLDQNGPPGVELMREMFARCGSYAPAPRTETFVSDVPMHASAVQRRDPRRKVQNEPQPTDRTRNWLRSVMGFVQVPVGLGEAREGRRVALTLAYSAHPVILQSTPLTPDARNEVVLRGQARVPASRVIGMINRGAGFIECHPDAAVSVPAFVLRCPMQDSDMEAYIDVLLERPGHVLWTQAARVLAVRHPERPVVHHDGGGHVADTDPASAFAAAVARARARSFRAAIAIEVDPPGMQETARTLFLAMSRGDDAAIDAAASAMRDAAAAGGLSEGVRFLAHDAGPASSAEAWVANALATPFGRYVLLAPDVGRLVVVPWKSTIEDRMGVVVIAVPQSAARQGTPAPGMSTSTARRRPLPAGRGARRRPRASHRKSARRSGPPSMHANPW